MFLREEQGTTSGILLLFEFSEPQFSWRVLRVLVSWCLGVLVSWCLGVLTRSSSGFHQCLDFAEVLACVVGQGAIGEAETEYVALAL